MQKSIVIPTNGRNLGRVSNVGASAQGMEAVQSRAFNETGAKRSRAQPDPKGCATNERHC